MFRWPSAATPSSSPSERELFPLCRKAKHRSFGRARGLSATSQTRSPPSVGPPPDTWPLGFRDAPLAVRTVCWPIGCSDRPSPWTTAQLPRFRPAPRYASAPMAEPLTWMHRGCGPTRRNSRSSATRPGSTAWKFVTRWFAGHWRCVGYAPAKAVAVIRIGIGLVLRRTETPRASEVSARPALSRPAGTPRSCAATRGCGDLHTDDGRR